MFGYQNFPGLVLNNSLPRLFTNQTDNLSNIFSNTAMAQYQNPVVFQNNSINFGINFPHQSISNIPNTSFIVFFIKSRIMANQ